MYNIILNWQANDPSQLIERYDVYQAITGQSFVKIGSTQEVTYTVSNLATGSVYIFKVEAINFAGTSPASVSVSTPNVPSKVIGLTLSFNENNVAMLNWTANPAIEYVYGYTINASHNGSNLVLAQSSTNSCVLDNLESGQGTYSFYVVASNLAGDGPASDRVATPSSPTAPQSLTLTVQVV
jgi:fibronectin type 3 domain-containing protein